MSCQSTEAAVAVSICACQCLSDEAERQDAGEGQKADMCWQDHLWGREIVLRAVTGTSQLKVSYKPERPELEA